MAYVAQPARRGPGRPPKKRGPGRPPKRKAEDAPDFCPEFLEPSLFVDIRVVRNEEREPHLVHFDHIAEYHTSDILSVAEDVVELAPKSSHSDITTQQLHLIFKKDNSSLFMAFPINSDGGSVIEFLQDFHKTKSPVILSTSSGTNISPVEVIDSIKNYGSIYYEITK